MAFTELHAISLTFNLNGLVATRAGVHHRRLLHQAFVDQQLHFNAAILRAAVAGVVFRNRIRFAIAERRHDASQWDVVVFNQIANHGIGAARAQRAISATLPVVSVYPEISTT